MQSAWWVSGLVLMMVAMPQPVSVVHATTNDDAVAVIIGNKSYQHRDVPSVDFAINDADAMKRFVIEVLGYREGNIIDLRDATQAQFVSTFGNRENHKGKLWSWIREGSSDVTVFYSGHGVPGLEDRRSYLLPVDADPETADLNGYPVDLLYANLAKLPAKSVTVYLDACFSGQTPKGSLVRASSGILVESRPPKAAITLTVLTAARGGQIASWDEEARHGIFTRYLLEGLRGAADEGEFGDGDGTVSLGEVKRYLDKEMSYAAKRRYRRIQTSTILGDEEVQLARVISTRVLPKSQSSPSPPRPAVSLYPKRNLTLSHRSVGDVFKDCDECPDMVVIAAGEFMMGSTEDERSWAIKHGSHDLIHSFEMSREPRLIEVPFAIGRTEVTVGQFRAFVTASDWKPKGDCSFVGFDEKTDESKNWQHLGFQQSDDHPVACLGWVDAVEYASWLSNLTGKIYRLPSDMEWEYSARAGTETIRYWGNDFQNFETCSFANAGPRIRNKFVNFNCSDGYDNTAPVGKYSSNKFGLFDVLGNVREWVENCSDFFGKATLPLNKCTHHNTRGGAWSSSAGDLRSSKTVPMGKLTGSNDLGFRVVQVLSSKQ